MDIDAGTRALDEGRSEGLGQRLVIDLPLLKGADQCPVDDETRRQLRELGLPDIIIDRWTQSQADLHLQFSNGSPFDQHLVAQELAEIEEKRRIEEMVRLLMVKDEPPLSEVVERTQPQPPALVAQQAVEEVMPPEYEAPLRTPAAIVTIEEAPPPAPAAPERTEEQPPLPLDRATPGDIEARNLEAALDLAKVGIPVFPARVYWQNGRWKKKPIITGWQVVSADPERVRAWWRKYPQAVPGIPLGRPHLVAIDCDRHGGPDGIQTFSALAAEHGGLPPGPITATASGGLHFIFKQPSDGKSLGNIEGAFTGLGINVRGGHSGWIVAPGAVCPDGSEWRTADGSPSLVEAYRNGTIPVIPRWIVDMIRAPKPRKERAPKNKTEAKETNPTPDAAPSGTSRNMDRRGRAWAETVLTNGAAELAAKPPHSGRNELANALGFQLGTTIARNWVDRGTVVDALMSASEANGKIQDDGGPDRIRDTIERAIAAGMLKPHPDLADGRSQASRQRSGEHDDNWRNMLRSEVMWLQRIRPGGEHATLKSADDVLAKIGSTDGREIGRILDFKFSDYLEIGRRRDRCPSVLRPVDKTDDEIKGHRASIRNSPEKKAAKAETEKARRLRKKEEEAQQPPTNDLIAQRCKAIVGFAKKYPGKHRTGDLVRSLRPKKVFEGLTAKTCRNAVDKLLKLAESGKLPALSDHLTVIRETAKNRRATYTVEYRK